MRTSTSVSWFTSLSLLLLATTVSAQVPTEGFSLNRFAPAPTTEDGLALVLPRTLGHLRPGAALTLDYAHQPLVLSAPDADPEGAIVKHRLTGHINGALGLGDRYELTLHVPVTFAQTGDTPGVSDVTLPDPRTAAFGDMSLGGTVRVVGEDMDPFQGGIHAAVTLPTGNKDALSGDGSVGVTGGFSVVYHTERFSVLGNGGVQYRPSRDYGTALLGTELMFGAGAHMRFTEKLIGMTEFSGSTSFRGEQAFKSEGTPLEWLNGLRWTTPVKLVMTGGVGVGVTRAVGVPDVRVLFGLGWPPVRPPLEPPDHDKDGIADPDDACPDKPEDFDGFKDEDGCPDPDNDKDGIPDDRDSCPNNAEDIDGFEDEDGCPEKDNDKDGILDAADKCPNHAEDVDTFEDEDGCPDVDNDRDGLHDENDSCPMEPEDRDGFEDGDGCPDPDNDKDGVLDVDDNCPRAPGPASSQGCPSAVRIDRSQIRILHRIEFETNRAELRPSATPILHEVAMALNVNPQIKAVRIEGHTDDRGSEKHNRKLSDKRAHSVMQFLIDEGISQDRLTAIGVGEERPLVPNDSKENLQTNRRVEFHITDPDPNAAEAEETSEMLDAAGKGTGPVAPSSGPSPAAAGSGPSPAAKPNTTDDDLLGDI